VPPVGPAGRETNPDARLWAMLCHLAAFAMLLPAVPGIGIVLGPLIVWLIKKNEFPFVDEQGKEAVNFQLTMLIIALALTITCIGIVLLPILGVVDIVLVIIAAIRANEGEHYRYPYPLIIRSSSRCRASPSRGRAANRIPSNGGAGISRTVQVCLDAAGQGSYKQVHARYEYREMPPVGSGGFVLAGRLCSL
jgi:uncharacterized Tic20 family protein